MSIIDLEKAARETLRWLIITALNAGRPIGASETLILSAAQPVMRETTQRDIRRELEYLEDRGLVELDGKHTGAWHAKLTHHGIDVAEYTVPCHPGIARPEKWW